MHKVHDDVDCKEDEEDAAETICLRLPNLAQVNAVIYLLCRPILDSIIPIYMLYYALMKFLSSGNCSETYKLKERRGAKEESLNGNGI